MLSHMALIDNGDDERLVLLAANILPMPFSSSLVDVDGHHQHASVVAMEMHGITSGIRQHVFAWPRALHTMPLESTQGRGLPKGGNGHRCTLPCVKAQTW